MTIDPKLSDLLRSDLARGERIRRTASVAAAVAGVAPAISRAQTVLQVDPNLPRATVVPCHTVDPSANLIKNGDFESFSTNASGSLALIDDWTVFAGSGEYAPRGGSFSTFSGPLGNQIIDATAIPTFSPSGELSSDSAFSTRFDLLGGSQSVPTTQGLTYILTFEVRPTFRSSDPYADGVFAVGLNGYSPTILRVQSSGSLTYQLTFEAMSATTTVSFLDPGYAEKGVYNRADTTGWNLNSDTITQVATWDNVTLNAIPEPGLSGLLTVALVGCLLWTRGRHVWNRRLRRSSLR